RVALEAVDAGNAGQLRPVERPVGHHYKARAEGVATVGVDQPFRLVVEPADIFDLRLEQNIAIEIVVLADALRMLADLRREGILLLRHITRLFEQRQIDVSLDIALRAGIAVPVPGAAEVSTLLDDADVFKAGFAQSRRRDLAAEAAADDQDFHLVGLRLARRRRRDVRIVNVVAEVALHLDILFVAIGAKAPVAFLAILLTQRIGIEAERFRAKRIHGDKPPVFLLLKSSAASGAAKRDYSAAFAKAAAPIRWLRRSRPGVAPVQTPSSKVISPLTMVQR